MSDTPSSEYLQNLADGTVEERPSTFITLIPNREMELFFRLHQGIENGLHYIARRGEARGVDEPYPIPEMSVQQMFGIDPGSFVFIAKTMGESTQPWVKGLVERARTVEITTKLIDARMPSGDVLIKLHCYEHVYNGVHDIELVVQKHKYFEWIITSDEIGPLGQDFGQEKEIVDLAHRYLCTGLLGKLPPTCKYPPPHIPEVR